MSDDPRVSRALGASALLRAADAVIAAVWRAAASSRTAAFSRRAIQPWRDLGLGERRLATGVALIIASIVQVVLTVTHEVPAGWLWLVAPGVAATIGSLLVAAASHLRGVNQ